MFRNGILYIDDMDVKIALGLEEEDAPAQIKVLKDADCEELWNKATLKVFKETLEEYPKEQLQVLADYAVAHKILNLDKSNALRKKIGYDIVKVIQLGDSGEEK